MPFSLRYFRRFHAGFRRFSPLRFAITILPLSLRHFSLIDFMLSLMLPLYGWPFLSMPRRFYALLILITAEL